MKAGSSAVTIVLGTWALLSTVSGCDQEAECPRGTKATGSRCTQQLPDSIDVVPSVFQSGGDASGKDTTEGDAVQEDSTSAWDVFGETFGCNGWRCQLFRVSHQIFANNININAVMTVESDGNGTPHNVRLQGGRRWRGSDQLHFGEREDHLGGTASLSWASNRDRDVSPGNPERLLSHAHSVCSEPVNDIMYSPCQVGYGIVMLPRRTLFQCKQPFEFRVTTGNQPCLTIMAGADIPPYPGGFLRNNQTEGSPLIWSDALSLSLKSVLEDGQLSCELVGGQPRYAHSRAYRLYYPSQRGVCGAKDDFLMQAPVWYADQMVWREPRPSCGRFTSIASVEHKSWSGVENQNNRDEVSVDLGVQARLGWCGSVAETIDAQKDAHQCRRGREPRRDSAGRTPRKPRDRNAQQRAGKRQHL